MDFFLHGVTEKLQSEVIQGSLPSFMSRGLEALSHMLNLEAGVSPSIQELSLAWCWVSLCTVYLTPSGHIATHILQTSISARYFPPGLHVHLTSEPLDLSQVIGVMVANGDEIF